MSKGEILRAAHVEGHKGQMILYDHGFTLRAEALTAHWWGRGGSHLLRAEPLQSPMTRTWSLECCRQGGPALGRPLSLSSPTCIKKKVSWVVGCTKCGWAHFLIDWPSRGLPHWTTHLGKQACTHERRAGARPAMQHAKPDPGHQPAYNVPRTLCDRY